MWIFIAALCAVILGLLKLIFDLKHQLNFYQGEEERLQAQLASRVKSRELLVSWAEQMSDGEEFAAYFRRQGIRRIAIYGMTDVGELLYRILKDTDIEVVCGIDRSKNSKNLLVLKPETFQEDIDAIVVTIVHYFSEIYDIMRPKVGEETPILCLDEILYELEISDSRL